jgi:hypothetical protein
MAVPPLAERVQSTGAPLAETGRYGVAGGAGLVDSNPGRMTTVRSHTMHTHIPKPLGTRAPCLPPPLSPSVGG